MDTTRCSRCGGPIVEIDLSVDGSRLVMRSCSTCDAREWQRGDQPADLDEVLVDLTATGEQRRHKRSR